MLMVEVLGRGCQARVSEVSGMSRGTLIAGAKDLAEGRCSENGIDLDLELLVVLDSLVEPESRGDPMSPFAGRQRSTGYSLQSAGVSRPQGRSEPRNSVDCDPSSQLGLAGSPALSSSPPSFNMARLLYALVGSQ